MELLVCAIVATLVSRSVSRHVHGRMLEIWRLVIMGMATVTFVQAWAMPAQNYGSSAQTNGGTCPLRGRIQRAVLEFCAVVKLICRPCCHKASRPDEIRVRTKAGLHRLFYDKEDSPAATLEDCSLLSDGQRSLVAHP
jgi:hypothetical protein